MHLPTLTRSAAAAALLAIALAIGAGAAPAAATVSYVFTYTIGKRCVEMDAVGRITLTQKRGGTQVAKKSRTAGPDGKVTLCLGPLLVGDTLTATGGEGTRTMKVPNLRLDLDVTTNTVTGSVPKSALNARVTMYDRIGRIRARLIPVLTTPDAQGVFSLDMADESLQLGGGDGGWLEWTSPVRDSVTVEAAVPSFVVNVDGDPIAIFGKGGTTATLQLRSTYFVPRGTLTRSLTTTTATGRFTDAGATVSPGAGDLVADSRLPGKFFRVLPNTAVAEPGSINVTCLPGSTFLIAVLDGAGLVEWDVGDGFTPDGVISFILWASNPLPLGQTVLVACADADGVAQEFRTTVVPPAAPMSPKHRG